MPTENTKAIKAFPTECKCEEGERAVVAKISTCIKDRDGEILMPQGCNAKEYEKNPVVFWGHDYSMPIGKCAGFQRKDDCLIAKTVFAERPEGHEGEWLPDTILSLFKQGVLNAFSVGAEYIEARYPTKKDMDEYGEDIKRVISKWKLFEYSAVALPANPDAVTMAVSKGWVSEATAKKLFTIKDDISPKPEPTPEPAKPETQERITRVVRIVKHVGKCSTAKEFADMANARASGRIYI